MKIKVTVNNIEKVKTDATVVSMFEGMEHLEGDSAIIDKCLDGSISKLINYGEIKGKPREITIIYSLGKLPSDRIVIAGLGKKDDLTINKVRETTAEVCRQLKNKGISNIAITALGAGVGSITAEEAIKSVTEGAMLGVYTFRKHITKKDESAEIQQLTIIASNKAKLPVFTTASNKGRIIAEAAILARDMVNEPSNYMTPIQMAERAKKLAETYSLKLNVFDREKIKKLGMGALLAVSQGSQQPPRFIILQYLGKDTAEIDIALVGKGITFDSGGISIKPSAGMADMKGDMAGGAAVMAALSAIAQLKPKINVISIIPATENLPSGSALKPGDVITAMNGKTIEVVNTDAEGRLALADALSYARKEGAKYIIDVATLTGSCMMALGDVCSGAFGNNQELLDKVVAAGAETGELMWQMPMFEQYKEQNKSDIADIKNIGDKYAGAITAAQFLSEFVDDTPWIHLDIAGTDLSEKEQGYLVKGASGIPVRTLVTIILAFAN